VWQTANEYFTHLRWNDILTSKGTHRDMVNYKFTFRAVRLNCLRSKFVELFHVLPFSLLRGVIWTVRTGLCGWYFVLIWIGWAISGLVLSVCLVDIVTFGLFLVVLFFILIKIHWLTRRIGLFGLWVTSLLVVSHLLICWGIFKKTRLFLRINQFTIVVCFFVLLVIFFFLFENLIGCLLLPSSKFSCCRRFSVI
jgi:hypothetical protein